MGEFLIEFSHKGYYRLMKNTILEKINSLFTLESHCCYNKIIEKDNEIEIVKSKYSGSGIYEIREMMNIHNLLDEYKNYLNIIVKENSIVIEFNR